MGRMIYTTDHHRRVEELTVVFREKIYTDQDYTQEQLRLLVPSWNDDDEENDA